MRRLILLVLTLGFSAAMAQAVPITGKVVGPDNKPVVGAKVEIFTELVQYPPKPSLSLETDEAGTFKADLAPHSEETDAFGAVAVYAPGLTLGGGTLKKENLIKLETPKEVRGTVKDPEGRPVADAIVRLAAISPTAQPTGRFGYVMVPESVKDKFTIKSGADGQWVLSGVSATAMAIVILEDPRFMMAFVQVASGQVTPVAMVARPGAVITGKVVREDGTPAAGMMLTVTGVNGPTMTAVSAADGTYKLVGLMPGSLTVVATDPTGQWAATALPDIKTKVGETVQAPNHILTEGVLIEGTVTDDVQGTPVANVQIMAQMLTIGAGQPHPGSVVSSAKSDKEGRYKVRVVPGKHSISVWSQGGGYLPMSKGIEVEVTKGETKNVPIRLTKGLTLAGVAKDEQGKPLANAEFKANFNDRNQDGMWVPPIETKTDAEGKWKLEGLRPGQWDLAATGEWDIVTPKNFTAPTDKPIDLTLRKLNLITASGRVMSKDRKPLAGVRLKVNIRTPEGENRERLDTQDVSTDAEGRFAVTKLRPDAKISFSTTRLPGYKYLSGGKVTKQDGGFEVQDMLLLPLTGKVEGRVLDAAGKPVAGVKVISPGGLAETPIATDAAGKFTLGELPEEPVMIVAATKSGWAEAREVKGKTPINLTLVPFKAQPPKDIQRAYELLEEMWATTEGAQHQRDSIPVTLAAADPDLAVKLATRKDGSINDGILGQIISIVTKGDPARAAAWVPAQWKRLKEPYWKFHALAQLTLALVDTKPDVAKEYYRQSQELDKERTAKEPKDLQSTAQRAMTLSRIAKKLSLDAEAGKYTQVAVDYYKTLKDQPWQFGNLAALDAEAADKLMEGMDDEHRRQALQQGIQTSARYNVANAKHLLAKLIAVEKANENRGIYSTHAAMSLIQIVGKTDPADALAIARSLNEKDTYSRPLALAVAAQFQPKDQALKIYQEAADMLSAPHASLNSTTRLASMVYDLDPKLGATLFERAKERYDAKKAEAQMQDYEYDYDNDTAAFAYFYSRIDPGTSRIIIESEFARKKARPRGESNDNWQLNQSLSGLAAAMAAIDVDRALEMSWLMPPPDKKDEYGNNNPQYEAQRLIAQYILLSDTERHNREFRQWDAGNSWD